MKDTEYVDITFRQVDGHGFLPIVKFDEEEVYRGAFHQTIDDAMPVIENALYRLGINLGGDK